MTRIARLREQRKAAFDQRNGVKLTFMPFIAAAAVAALRRCPIVNASLENTGKGLAIRYHRQRSIWESPSLLTLGADCARHPPCGAAQLLPHIARTIADLAALRARSKKLLARRSRRIDIHAYQCRRIRRRVRHADHQPARFGHSCSWRPAQGAGCAGRRMPKATTPLRFGRCSISVSASITASSTARAAASSCWNSRRRLRAGIRRLGKRLPRQDPTLVETVCPLRRSNCL